MIRTDNKQMTNITEGLPRDKKRSESRQRDRRNDETLNLSATSDIG